MRTRTGSRTGRTSLAGVLLAVLVVAAIVPAWARDDGQTPGGFAVHDDETVYVVAAADGSLRDVVVVDWLRIEGHGALDLLDPGAVVSAAALEDDIEPEVTDAGVVWALDVDGRRDFFYRAQTDLWEFHLMDFWPNPGDYTLRLECVGKNKDSTGHYIGLNALRLRERRPRVKAFGYDKDKDWRKEQIIYR